MRDGREPRVGSHCRRRMFFLVAAVGLTGGALVAAEIVLRAIAERGHGETYVGIGVGTSGLGLHRQSRNPTLCWELKPGASATSAANVSL